MKSDLLRGNRENLGEQSCDKERRINGTLAVRQETSSLHQKTNLQVHHGSVDETRRSPGDQELNYSGSGPMTQVTGHTEAVLEL